MAGLQMSGLASGLDTKSIIAQLMAVERIPRHRVERAQGAVQQRQDHLREISTKLKALKTAAQDLQASGTWTPKQELTTSDATRVGARLTGSAPVAAGTYDVVVQNLATAETEKWTTRNHPIASTLTITDSVGTATNVSIGANATLDQIVAAVNNASNAPVTALNDNGQLRFTSKTLGAPSAFTVSGVVLNAQQSQTVGVNGNFTVNGVAYTSTNNLDTTAIPGAELSLVGITAAGVPVKVTATQAQTDKAGVAAKLKAFVEAYNAVVDFTRGKITEKSDPKAATITDAKKGVLYGDAGLTTVLSNLRRALMDPLTGAGNAATMDEMHEVGLSTGSAVSTLDPSKVQGKLTFDEAKFNKAWDSDRASVERLVRGNGTPTGQGFTQRMDSLLKGMTDVGGLLDGRINGAGSELKTLASRLANMDRRLEKKEEFYKRQFTALETAMSRSQSIQQQLAGQLAGLPQAGRE